MLYANALSVNAETHYLLRNSMQSRIFQRMESNKKTLVAKNLIWLMEKHKTNPTQLEKETEKRGKKVPQSTIFRVINGISEDPKTATLKPLADYFGVPVADLKHKDLTDSPVRNNVVHGAPIKSTDDSEENPLISRIRKVKLKISAGISGFAIDPDYEDGNPIYFRKDWIESRGYRVNNLIAIVVQGQSMEPTLNNGDTVVINTADTTPRDGDVYAINYEGEAIVKRMIRDSGVWWLSSDNQDKSRYPNKQCSGDGCIVIGKVIHKQSEHI